MYYMQQDRILKRPEWGAVWAAESALCGHVLVPCIRNDISTSFTSYGHAGAYGMVLLCLAPPPCAPVPSCVRGEYKGDFLFVLFTIGLT